MQFFNLRETLLTADLVGGSAVVPAVVVSALLLNVHSVDFVEAASGDHLLKPDPDRVLRREDGGVMRNS